MADRDQLIQYLLHQMPEEDRAALGERWMSDPELHEQLRMAEAELFDAYSRGELTSEERQHFEEHLLVSAGQRQKLAFAAALQEELPGRTHVRRVGPPAFAAAAAIVILAVLGFWYALQNRDLRREIEVLQRQLRPSPAGLYAVAVPPDSVRGAGAENALRLPPDTEMLRIDFQFEAADREPLYSAQISHMGQTVWSEDGIRGAPQGNAFVAPVWIPARVLESGSYEVRLAAGGKAVGFYRFRVANR